MVAASDSPTGRVVLVGAHGHGRWHLRNLGGLAERTGIRLVGICDPRPPDEEMRDLAGDVPVSADLTEILAETRPDVTIVCTPIHTHADLTLRAVAAGTHVLLEKPPAPTLAEYRRLLDGVESSGKACQVGFQDLGSAAVAHVRDLVAAGTIGPVRGIGGAGTWIRDSSYYARSAWAGRRLVDGVPVMDGALTNPFAHAVASALALAGANGPGDLAEIEVELYHANSIEADDTSCLRVRTTTGVPILIAVTLAAEQTRQPRLVVHGEKGQITLVYKTGEVRLEVDGAETVSSHPSTGLLENLLSHVADPGVPLLVPLRATQPFMEVLEAVRLSPDPAQIPAGHVRTEDAGEHRRCLVPGVDEAVERAAQTLRLFSELDVPWARPPSLRQVESVRGVA